MSKKTQVSNLKINKLTQEQYDELVRLDQVSDTELYLTPDANYVTEEQLNAYHDNTKQNVINDLAKIRSGADLGATAIQNTNDCMHISGNETSTGVKSFNGGKGGNDVGIKSLTGMLIGSVTSTAYTQYGTIRNCNNKAHTGSYYINSDGSVLFRHKTGTASAEGTTNDAMFTIHPVNGIKAGWSGTEGTAVGDLHDVLIDTIEYSKLNTTAKDIIGAINELKSRLDSLG